MIKIAFFDIDGTLVGFGEKEIKDETLDILDRLKARDIKVFVSTGRPKELIYNLKGYPFDGYITMNGSLVTIGDRVIHSLPIPHESAVKVAEISERLDIPCVAFFENASGINTENEVTEKINNLIHVGPFPRIPLSETVRGNEVYQFTTYVTDEQVDMYYRDYVPNVAWARWHPDFLDVTPMHSSKGVAVERVCEALGISPEEAIAFGDGGNDIDMLRTAGIGVAMGNATEDVKAAADYVTSDVDDDGLLRALEKFNIL